MAVNQKRATPKFSRYFLYIEPAIASFRWNSASTKAPFASRSFSVSLSSNMADDRAALGRPTVAASRVPSAGGGGASAAPSRRATGLAEKMSESSSL